MAIWPMVRERISGHRDGMANQNHNRMTHPLPVSRWGLPDSDICSAAYALAESCSPGFLHNHCVRSYLFGRELAAIHGLRSGVDYDEEVVFLAAILHDLGLTAYGSGDQRFEVEGADAAGRFLRELGFAEARVRTVWETIALHTCVGLGHRFGTEHAVCHGGIDLDVVGTQKGLLPAGFADRVHAEWPRQNLGYAIAKAISIGTQGNPTKAPPFSFPAHVHELVNGASPVTFSDVVASSGWGDSPL